jgi:hypothetical protein
MKKQARAQLACVRAIRAWFPAARAPATAVEAMAEIKGELPGHRSVEDGSSKRCPTAGS